MVLLAFSMVVAFAVGGTVPHIVLIVADDYGWNDIGYHQNKQSSANPEGNQTTNNVIATPNLDQLASEGVKLENYYVQPLCSPTRGTIMSGRYPSHTGIGPDVIKPTHPYAMPKVEQLIPDVLKSAGYATHAVGKWHLGYCDERYSPLFRGFDSFFGYLNGAEDYFAHTRSDSGFHGYDLREGNGSNTLPPIAPDKACPNGKHQDWCYSTHLFTERVHRIVKDHSESKTDTPFFLYLPYQAIHGPLQAPDRYVNQYKHIASQPRRMGAAMVAAMDEGVGNITAALKKYNMWNDTVVIFTTDNGGPLGQANNYPLRGHKSTNWEGGVRGVAFVRGTDSDLAPLPKQTVSSALAHSTDWLPTVAALAKASTSKCQKLDGFDVYPTLSGTTAGTRTSVAHNVPAATTTGVEAWQGAFRLGKFKVLFTGMQTVDDTIQTPPEGFTPANPGTVPKGVPVPLSTLEALSTSATSQDQLFEEGGGTVTINTYLFDIEADPTESNNLAATNPDDLKSIVQAFRQYRFTAVRDLALTYTKTDPASNPQLREDQSWGPFTDSKLCKWI